MEYLKDFNAFQNLYIELLDEYNNRREENFDFGERYQKPHIDPLKFIREHEKMERVRIPNELMDFTLDILVKMEKEVRQLPIKDLALSR